MKPAAPIRIKSDKIRRVLFVRVDRHLAERIETFRAATWPRPSLTALFSKAMTEFLDLRLCEAANTKAHARTRTKKR
jgi:hypothetical protein